MNFQLNSTPKSRQDSFTDEAQQQSAVYEEEWKMRKI